MAHDPMFALFAGVSMAAYSIFLRLASPGIHPALGATIITGVTFLANLALTLTLRATGSPVTLQLEAYLIIVVGLAAACAALFTLSAYASGLKVTSSFVIGGVAILVLLIGSMVPRRMRHGHRGDDPGHGSVGEGRRGGRGPADQDYHSERRTSFRCSAAVARSSEKMARRRSMTQKAASDPMA
jgi:hypothetical protein